MGAQLGKDKDGATGTPNLSSFAKASQAAPNMFVVQSRGDWDKQLNVLMRDTPTLTRTVVLPPGVDLSDPRLADGEVVDEKRYSLKVGALGTWPTDAPFEADIDGQLVPPCWGKTGANTHYAVYPDARFKTNACGLCELAQKSRVVSIASQR